MGKVIDQRSQEQPEVVFSNVKGSRGSEKHGIVYVKGVFEVRFSYSPSGGLDLLRGFMREAAEKFDRATDRHNTVSELRVTQVNDEPVEDPGIFAD